MPVNSAERPQNINQPTISRADLECLEHLRNVGQPVGDLMQVQDCTAIRRDPAQQLQLTSVIYLMTAQARRRGRTLQSALADRGGNV